MNLAITIHDVAFTNLNTIGSQSLQNIVVALERSGMTDESVQYTLTEMVNLIKNGFGELPLPKLPSAIQQRMYSQKHMDPTYPSVGVDPSDALTFNLLTGKLSAAITSIKDIIAGCDTVDAPKNVTTTLCSVDSDGFNAVFVSVKELVQSQQKKFVEVYF